MQLTKQTCGTPVIISLDRETLRQSPLDHPPKKEGGKNKVRISVFHCLSEGAASIVPPMTMVLASPMVLLWILLTASNLSTSYWQVLSLALTVMTAKFYKVFQPLCWMGKNFDKWKACIWAMELYGVVSRLPVTSPGHRPMETGHVH